MYNREELCHYGVLGMKWGHRRAKVNMRKADRAMRKGNVNKATQYKKKANKIESKHISRAGKATYDKVSNQKMGKTVAQSLIFGTYGALKYNQMRSKNYSRGMSAVAGFLGHATNLLTSGGASVIEPRVRAKRKKDWLY